jgi:hypothetical protein
VHTGGRPRARSRAAIRAVLAVAMAVVVRLPVKTEQTGPIQELVGRTGHYLNRPTEFDTSVLGLIRAYRPNVYEDR